MSTPSLLIVDDDPIVIQTLSKALDGLGRIRFALRGNEGLELARAQPPDLILADAEMPGLSGFELLRALKNEPELAQVPVLMITSHGDADTEEAAFHLGAADFIAKPIRPLVVAARVRTQLRLKAAMDQLQRAAAVDELTQLANRRAFDSALIRAVSQYRRGHPLALLMIDVDHFKRYNDRYGHPAGDAALQAVAGVLRACAVRPGDLAARYGGEEFALLLPDTPAAGALSLAATLRQRLAALALPHAEGLGGCITLSIGGAGLEGDSQPAAQRGQPAPEAQTLVERADRALYRAKREGRDRCVWLD